MSDSDKLSGLGGSPVVAVLGEADSALHVLHCVWSGDDFVITISGNATADRTVFWTVNGG